MEKAERINRVLNSLEGESELFRRLPELEFIHDDELQSSVIRTYIDGCPDVFWERASSSSGKYHPSDERDVAGNWIHTKRVFAEYCNISQSYLNAGLIDEHERDEGKAAALIHDMMKYGWPSDRNVHTVRDHDLIAASVAEHIGGANDTVVSMIKSHMGPWGEGPQPETDNQWLLHLADKSASNVNTMIHIYKPAKEITSEWEDIDVMSSSSVLE